MANTPFVDKGTQEIISSYVNGLQDAVNKIEQSLNMDTEEKENQPLTLIEDTKGKFRIAQAIYKNWLTDPAPVIEQNIGTWTTITEGFTIDHAGGALIFLEDQAGKEFRASFTCIKNTSEHNSLKASFDNHSTRHESGGADEINLEDLQGESAAHKAHKYGEMPHLYGERFAWQYNPDTDSLDLVVV